MSQSTNDSMAIDLLIAEKIKIENQLKDAARRIDRLQKFLDQIGLNGSKIGDGFNWEHNVSTLFVVQLDERRLRDDLVPEDRKQILMAAKGVQKQDGL